MNSFVEEVLCLLKKSTTEDHNTCGSITNFVVLRLRELDHQFGHLMINVHHLEDGGSVVGDSDVSIRADHQLVQPFGAKAGLQDVGHRLGSQDVRLDGIAASQPGLLHLVLEDHEGPAELVKGQRAHGHWSSRPPHTRWHHHYEAGENLSCRSESSNKSL